MVTLHTVRRCAITVGVCLLLIAAAVAAEKRATTEEARAMAERAAALLDTEGPQRIFPLIVDPAGGFLDRELFVVVMDRRGHVLAHGVRPSYVGKNMADLRDLSGNPFVQRMLDMPENGFISYYWQNPLTEEVERKTSFVVHLSDYVLFVGAYEPNL